MGKFSRMAMIQREHFGDYSEDWAVCLSAIKTELPNSASYDAYFRASELLRIENSTAVIALPNQFQIEMVEQNYEPLILAVIRKETDLTVEKIIYETKNDLFTLDSQKQVPVLSIEKELETVPHTPTVVVNYEQFYPEYTFDLFVEGDSNRVAYLSAVAVAEAPGKTPYNPLIIYGNTGLGKTHLLQAIGHYAKEEATAEKVYYITALDFLSRFVENRGDITSFYKEFEDVDLLLVDDIQFFSKKPATQKKFLTIFNSLINRGKQIVLTSDRLPEEIPDMEERLTSQLKGGLRIQIDPPLLKTRLTILRRKAKSDNIQLSDEVLKFMASQVTTNVRALEGVFTKVLASSIFANKELDIEAVKELLTDFKRERKERITVELVQEKVAEYFEISSNQLRAHTRIRTVTYPRNIAMYIARQLTKQSLRAVGLQFGNRDYSTVIHACKKIEADLQTSEQLRQEIEHITAIIKA